MQPVEVMASSFTVERKDSGVVRITFSRECVQRFGGSRTMPFRVSEGNPPAEFVG